VPLRASPVSLIDGLTPAALPASFFPRSTALKSPILLRPTTLDANAAEM
jgi:hypothetical protein